MSTGRIRRWIDSMPAFLAAMKASGLFGRGSKLMRADRAAEAVDVLEQALALLGPRRTGFEDPPNFSTRISVVTLLAQAAARAGDHELAAESVREGMALWSARPVGGVGAVVHRLARV
jgi:hypothetical protein